MSAEHSTSARYVEFAPPQPLRAYVQCLWARRSAAVPRTHLVFPDGCADIIATDSSVHIAGPMTVAESVDLGPRALVAGIRFRPGAASAALGVSAMTLLNSNPPIGGLWGREGDRMTSRLTSVESARERLILLADAMIARLPEIDEPDDIAITAGQQLTRQPEIPIAEMASQLGLSERQLRRRISESVGYSPRTLARIMRFQRFLAARESSPDSAIADLAASAGYADQPHLTRECRELSGLTPAQLLNRD
ncbi:helix-turn-helix transcriptional regulator [Smaragdicoccus niigatensis]|uniref:helix-turn-helix transcriptional regulator n=1 Tax=Smaragdicoccus niigatensis TaxID=359359 RepID=UPI0003739814|nr:helix-turn-helix transcriptional regulator [Smaragdicoccus niigatensis]